ncbi:hypothetical protein MAA_07166 [Metarhizium robertsii ARSEF 23]|uniref:Rhodopsin domain-containing protein n=1 Tax=Metarhizium robertsii (strain ARSEF 23 / ATCC MYA-3075) TaxID=655844 RepID=E9F4G7_METRA|nr:uncharacterized protein MAA_07166 [Metarhizium robertsii ARSEF 23]EFY97524.2 hypothetical protein MAA_07166 [Metarhizium robertsii ARSEF 23]
MAPGDSSDPAAQAAAAAAFHRFTVELWTLYGIGVFATFLRTYARIRAVGARNLRADDYLVWVGVAFYTAQAALGYSIGNVAHGLANNGMSDAERVALSPSNPEYQSRVIGSKIQVAGWTTYSLLIGFLKLSVLAFYIRLTDGLGRPYKIRIVIGFILVIGTTVACILTNFLACRPFSKYWQINPDPGNACQAAVSRPIIWVSFAANVCTDIYLILIPLPMLWGSSLKTIKKIASTIVLGAGIFVLVCATLKSVFVLVDTVNGAQLAGSWGTREAFVAVITTNLPMLFPLFRVWLAPLFGSALRSSKKSYKSPTGLVTFGGGGGAGSSTPRNRPRTANPITANMTFSESEERIVGAIKMDVVGGARPSNAIVVSNQVEVTHSDRNSPMDGRYAQHTHEHW